MFFPDMLPAPPPTCLPFDPCDYERRPATPRVLAGIAGPVTVGGEEVIKVGIRRGGFEALAHKLEKLGDFKPDFVTDDVPVLAVDPRETCDFSAADGLVTVKDGLDVPTIAAFRLLAARLREAGCQAPVLLKDTLHPATTADSAGGDFLQTLLRTSAPSSFRAKALPANRSAWPSTCCKPPARAFSRRTTWPARAAGGRSSTCRKQRRASRRPPAT